jgi:RimJ/RimL family protein N-acetyltransferase
MTESVETPRLRLERFTAELATAVLSDSRSDDWIGGFPTGGERRIAEWLVRGDVAVAEWPFVVFVIRELESGLLIGGATFHSAPRERTVEIGYGLADAARGRGFASEACSALVELAFASGAVDRVTAHVDPLNERSMAVLRRSGFAPIGEPATAWAVDRA